RFNSLVATLGGNETLSSEGLKRACLEICWPEDFRLHIAPAELGEIAQVAWCQHLVTLGEAAQEGSRHDLHSQEVTFIEMAKASGLNLGDTDPVLALYLASQPAWNARPPGKADLSVSGLRTASVDASVTSESKEGIAKLRVPDFTEMLDGTMAGLSSESLLGKAEFLAEIAKAGDQRSALKAFDDIVPVLRSLEKPPADLAPAVGNAALRFASRELIRQAAELHFHAVRADPHHANVCQNFV